MISPSQTGLASSALSPATPQIDALTAAHPRVGVQALWDPAATTLDLDTGVAEEYAVRGVTPVPEPGTWLLLAGRAARRA